MWLLLVMILSGTDEIAGEVQRLLCNTTAGTGEDYVETSVRITGAGAPRCLGIQEYYRHATAPTQSMTERRVVPVGDIAEVSVQVDPRLGEQRNSFLLFKYRRMADKVYSFRDAADRDLGSLTAFRLGTYRYQDAARIAALIEQLRLAANNP